MRQCIRFFQLAEQSLPGALMAVEFCSESWEVLQTLGLGHDIGSFFTPGGSGTISSESTGIPVDKWPEFHPLDS